MSGSATPHPPSAPSLVVGQTRAAWLSPGGPVEALTLEEAARRLTGAPAPPLVCHGRQTLARLGVEPQPLLDLLELYAFVRPAGFCLPTPRGLARALDRPVPADIDEAASLLPALCGDLLLALARDPGSAAPAVARAMARGGWIWAPFVENALGSHDDGRDVDVWRRLDEWPELPPDPQPGSRPVDPAEARRRLSAMLGEGAEPRPSQSDYAMAVTAAFQPREVPGSPNLILAEAGTGVGKTLGYLAPATLWAEINDGPVWVATYTRNLQHQIDSELGRRFPDPAEKARKVVIRKGRENYLCLLNLEESLRGLPARPEQAVALGLMARWTEATRDGDMMGGDFPSWLADLVGRARTTGLADRRGECIYSACPHWRKCFIEHSQRKARRAEIVVANHALVMIQAALADPGDPALPTRLVLDEGHHLFDAADGAFAAHLSALETVEMRRWLLGSEGRGAGRARGLRRRLDELVLEDSKAAEDLDRILQAARALPGEGWQTRLTEGAPQGPAEAFLFACRRQVYARAASPDSPYGLECDTRPASVSLLETAAALAEALRALGEPLAGLARRLGARLDDEADDLETGTRVRIEAAVRSLERRRLGVSAWRATLDALHTETPEEFVDWLGVERMFGRDVDVGLHRHWLDPTLPLATHLLAPAHGVVVTSATLRDGSGDMETDWQVAEARSGAAHLPAPPLRARHASPFDYAGQTRVLVVRDVRKDQLDQVAAAYRALFLASQGGALGLFTAVSRLRAVHERLTGPLDEAGLQLLAQHVDRLDTTTLIDIFRAEEDACLLGTDAVRDGVDVPGRALRLIVFDRVPWPRPDILHRARREAFGRRRYEDMITRLRLKQAYGRLVRRADDRGIFVLLDPMMPSRLAGAFPEGVEMERCGLAEAVAATRAFFAEAP